MTTRVKFYVATLQAAVDRAARIAPNKGAAFDKAAGLVLDISPNEETARLRSTNLDVYYTEIVRDVIDYGDEPVSWRLSSSLLAGIISGLPHDKEVTFVSDGERHVRITCGKRRAKLALMASDIFPTFDWPGDDGMDIVHGLTESISRVAWAAHADDIPFVGINIDGERLNATNRYQFAMVDCKVPVSSPLTASLTLLSSVLRNLPGDAKVKAGNQKLYLSVGDEIRIIATTFAHKFPDLSEVMERRGSFAFTVKVQREALHSAISAMLVLVKSERYPRLNIHFLQGTIALAMSIPGVGDMVDEVEADFDDPDGELEIEFTPNYLMAALDASASKFVDLHVGPLRTQLIKITDGTGYEASVMPLGPVSRKQER